MPRNMESKRKYDRERMRAIRARHHAERKEYCRRCHEKQLTDDHDWKLSDEIGPEYTLEAHRYWSPLC
jgi:hypothetical protein